QRVRGQLGTDATIELRSDEIDRIVLADDRYCPLCLGVIQKFLDQIRHAEDWVCRVNAAQFAVNPYHLFRDPTVDLGKVPENACPKLSIACIGFTPFDSLV